MLNKRPNIECDAGALCVDVGRLLPVLEPLRDVAVDAEYGAAVDKDLCEDVEDTVVDFAGWWEHEGDECHDDATGEKDDGGQFLVVWIPVE